MICRNCGTNIQDNATFCPNCGTVIQFAQTTQNSFQPNGNDIPSYQMPPAKEPFFKKTWFLVLLFIFLPPFGIIFMWLTKKVWAKKIKIALSIILAIWTIMTFAIASSDTSTPAISDELSTEADVTTTEITTKKQIDINIQELMDETERDEVYCTTVWETMQDYGFKSISDITFVTDNGGTCYSYRFSTIGYGNTGMLMLDNNGIYYLSFGDTTLYDAEKTDNKIVNFADFVLSSSQINKYIAATQTVTEQCLLSPKSADFPSSTFTDAWKVYFSDDVVTVTAYVDADNAYGVQIRNNFTAQYSHSTGELTYFELGGEVISGSKR